MPDHHLGRETLLPHRYQICAQRNPRSVPPIPVDSRVRGLHRLRQVANPEQGTEGPKARNFDQSLSDQPPSTVGFVCKPSAATPAIRWPRSKSRQAPDLKEALRMNCPSESAISGQSRYGRQENRVCCGLRALYV